MTSDTVPEGSKRKARSTKGDPPATCEYGDCSEPVEYRIRFREPEDHVYYCREHKSTARNYPGQRYAKSI